MDNVQCVWLGPLKYVPNPEQRLLAPAIFFWFEHICIDWKKLLCPFDWESSNIIEPWLCFDFFSILFLFFFLFFSLRFKLLHMTLDILILCRRWERRMSPSSPTHDQHSKQSDRESHYSIFSAIKVKQRAVLMRRS